MELADAERLEAEYPGSTRLPPFDVRMSLRGGDWVELVAVSREGHPTALGAFVLGSRSPGRYVGELEDGTRLEFAARHVADAAWADSPPPHQMGGIFDWFTKKKGPEQPAAPRKSMFEAFSQPQLPAIVPGPELPAAAAPPETKAPKKSMFAIFQPKSQPITPTLPEGEAPKKKSIFDIFRLKQKPEGGYGTVAVRPETPVAPVHERVTMFSTFEPNRPGPVESYRERAASMISPEGPGPLAPFVERAQEMFQTVQPSPEPETFEAKKTRQMELFSGLFPGGGEDVPIGRMFEAFQPSEVEPEEAAIPKGMPRYSKVLPMPARRTLLPTPEDVARGILTFWRPEVFQELMADVSTDQWKLSLETNGVAEDLLETLGSCGGQPDIFQETSSFFHIPWEEFERRAEKEEHDEEVDWIDTSRIWEEIIMPLGEIVERAWEMIRPPELPGRMALQWADEEHQCMLGLFYVEGERQEEPEPGMPEPSGRFESEEQEEEAPPPSKRQAEKPAKKAKKKKKGKK